jgi:FMN phosphatase YigB (HAD superfamily)
MAAKTSSIARSDAIASAIVDTGAYTNCPALSVGQILHKNCKLWVWDFDDTLINSYAYMKHAMTDSAIATLSDDALLADIPFYSYFRDLVIELCTRGVKVAIASFGVLSIIQAYMNRIFGFNQKFFATHNIKAFRHNLRDVFSRKTMPRNKNGMIFELMEFYKISSFNNVCLFDDAVANITAALEIGIYAIFIDDLFNPTVLSTIYQPVELHETNKLDSFAANLHLTDSRDSALSPTLQTASDITGGDYAPPCPLTTGGDYAPPCPLTTGGDYAPPVSDCASLSPPYVEAVDAATATATATAAVAVTATATTADAATYNAADAVTIKETTPPIDEPFSVFNTMLAKWNDMQYIADIIIFSGLLVGLLVFMHHIYNTHDYAITMLWSCIVLFILLTFTMVAYAH